MIPDEIQQGIEVTIGVLQRTHPEFNPNIDSTYMGLCNEASDIFIKAMKSITGKEGKMIHGEIAHNSRVLSKFWDIEHTWVKYDGYYVDITLGQFRDLIPDIPSVYISKRKPKWFLPDEDNWHLKVQHFQYQTKGAISDFLYRIKHRGGQ